MSVFVDLDFFLKEHKYVYAVVWNRYKQQVFISSDGQFKIPCCENDF